jgi:uncharacterized membrane protein
MRPFMRHVLRGMATVLPPVLTLIVLLWMGRTLDRYVLRPIHTAAVSLVARSILDVRKLGAETNVDDANFDGAKVDGAKFGGAPTEADPPFPSPGTNKAGSRSAARPLHVGSLQPATAQFDHREYVRLASGEYVPAAVVQTADEYLDGMRMPRTALGVYEAYVEARWLRPAWFLPACLLLIVALTYIAGRIGNRNLGRLVRSRAQKTVGRVPLVSRVYATVRQMVQHILAGPKFELTRVVAVEFPRKGAWTIAYVINEGLAQVADRAREPVLTLFFDTSPVPMSGYTIMVPKSQTIPINMALDDALKFVMSCGIIVPPQQNVREARAPATHADNPHAASDHEAPA